MPTKKGIGKRLKAVREALGLTQAEMGEFLGVKQETISRREAGLVEISVAKLGAIAKKASKALDTEITLMWLLESHGPPPDLRARGVLEGGESDAAHEA